MTTPRAESIEKYHSGEPTIRPPKGQYDGENKIDHYGVLAQIVDRGVTEFITHGYSPESFLEAQSLPDLSHLFEAAVREAVLGALESDQFVEHFAQLHASQEARHLLDSKRWWDIKFTIRAGTDTFISSFDLIFRALLDQKDPDTAARPESWKIADRLAKLPIQQFTAYRDMYLTEPHNWPMMLDHLEPSVSGAYNFKQGYPGNAVVPKILANPEATVLSEKDFHLGAPEDAITIKDIPAYDGQIGCPITFRPDTLKNLWHLYSAHAHHIVTTWPEANTDGSEAFPR